MKTYERDGAHLWVYPEGKRSPSELYDKFFGDDDVRNHIIGPLVEQANWAAANEPKLAAAQQMADAIRRYHGLPFFGPTQRRGVDAEGVVGLALRDALAAFEAEAAPEPLTITVPPDTAEEIVAMLTKVAKLLEQKGGK